MEKVWIIGAGKFGLKAARYLKGKAGGDADVLMVDENGENLIHARSLGCQTETGDGITFLFSRLTREDKPDWVVPAVPVHLAFEWCRRRMGEGRMSPFPLPKSVRTVLPNPFPGAGSDICVSHADFLCPPGCSEPNDRCTQTGAPRKPDMFSLLADLGLAAPAPFVIRSVQLGPGVGGYRPAALFDLLDRLERHRGRCFVATACRCHGVVSGAVIT